MGQIKFGRGSSPNNSVIYKESVIEVEKPVFSVVEKSHHIEKPVFIVKDNQQYIEKPVIKLKEVQEVVKKPSFTIEEQVEVIKKPVFSVECESKQELLIAKQNLAVEEIRLELNSQKKVLQIGLGIVILIQLLSLFGV